MKIKTIVLSSLVFVCSAAFSDSAVPQVSIQQALAAAEKAGYTNIHKIEFEHGQWEVEGQDAQGKKFEVKIDATTGSLSKEDND